MIELKNQWNSDGTFDVESEASGRPDRAMVELIVGVHSVLKNISELMQQPKLDVTDWFIEEFIDSTKE